MLYASFSQGHKTGGFSDRIESPMQNFEYDAENVDAFELGAKTTWLEGKLAFNIALYHMSIKGLQLATQLPGDVPAFSVSNAADSTSQGVEMDGAWLVGENSHWVATLPSRMRAMIRFRVRRIAHPGSQRARREPAISQGSI